MNLAAAAQITAFRQIEIKARRALETTKKIKLPIETLSISGGCASNKHFQDISKAVAKEYDLNLGKYLQSNNIALPSPGEECDSAISVAWMGLEYLNAGTATDIRGHEVYPFSFIPLGNYIDLMHSSFKGLSRPKILSRKQKEIAGQQV